MNGIRVYTPRVYWKYGDIKVKKAISRSTFRMLNSF